jgi:hypothetical protein
MRQLNFIKHEICRIATLLTALFFCGNISAADIEKDISSGSVTVPGTSTDNYIIYGNTSNDNIGVIIEAGYKGTVTLRNLNITHQNGSMPAIHVKGTLDCSNYTPVTNVNIVLQGNNELFFYGSTAAAFQVDQGAQINISAIDPSDNASGMLYARATSLEPGTSSSPQGGAAIGASTSSTAQGHSDLYNPNGTLYKTNQPTAGGNIIINSGTVKAWGGHGAGIGGGFQTYYNGIIIVTGGIVDARAVRHAAGLGSGCPTGSGVLPYYADKSAIIALPPCQITAIGAGAGSQDPSLALAGTKYLTYVNDPAKPLVTIRTVDREPGANIYLDLTQTPGLQDIFDEVFPDFDLTHVRIGRTSADAGAIMQVHGLFQNLTTFFTDASSHTPATLGRPYMPVNTTTSAAQEIVLPLFEGNISFTDYRSTPLEEGYSSTQAQQKAYCFKLEYKDSRSFTHLSFELQQGAAASDFKSPVFLASDSQTVVPAPQTLNNGDVYYVVAPLKDGKTAGSYTDVILIRGEFNLVGMAGYIRRISDQLVVKDDTETNQHIRVTANPDAFAKVYPTDTTATLTLLISHANITGSAYSESGVTAKYLISTEPVYANAVADVPLGQWANLAIPSATGGGNPSTDTFTAQTVVPFAGRGAGTYYIHWYAVSGAVMAHSKDVDNPARQYGGFGPYRILVARTVAYDGNGNDGGMAPATVVCATGSQATVPGNTGGLTKNGATFIGWSFAPSGLVSSTAGAPADLMAEGYTFVADADTVLYAVWALDAKGSNGNGGGDSTPDYLQYNVTYNGNGNTAGVLPTDLCLYNRGDRVTTRLHGDLAKSSGSVSAVFAGWTPGSPVTAILTCATAADTTRAFVREGAGFTIADSTRFYAVWSADVNGNGEPDVLEPRYRVSYNGNGHTSGTAPGDGNDYLFNMPAVLKDRGNLARSGAVFIGWNPTAVVPDVSSLAAEQALTAMRLPGDGFTVAGNAAWYAVWATDAGGDGIPDYRQLDVTFNKGSLPVVAVAGLPYTHPCAKGDTFTLTDWGVTVPGYVMLGWHTIPVPVLTNPQIEAAVKTVPSFFGLDAPFTVPDIGMGTLTLYAVWARDLNANGAPDYADDKPVTYGSSMPLRSSLSTPQALSLRSGPAVGNVSLRNDLMPDWQMDFDKPALNDAVYFTGCTYNYELEDRTQLIDPLIYLDPVYCFNMGVSHTKARLPMDFMIKYGGVLADMSMTGGINQEPLGKISITADMIANGFTMDSLINHYPFTFDSVRSDGEAVLKMYFVDPLTGRHPEYTATYWDKGGRLWDKPFKSSATSGWDSDTLVLRFKIYNKPVFESNRISLYIDSHGYIRLNHLSGTPLKYMMRSINGLDWRPATDPLSNMEQLSVDEGVSLSLRETDKVIAFQKTKKDYFLSPDFDPSYPHNASYLADVTDICTRAYNEALWQTVVTHPFYASEYEPIYRSNLQLGLNHDDAAAMLYSAIAMGWYFDFSTMTMITFTSPVVYIPDALTQAAEIEAAIQSYWPTYARELADKVPVPDPCRAALHFTFGTAAPPEIERYVEIHTLPGVTSDPAAEVQHYVKGHDDFTFTLTFPDDLPLKVTGTGVYSRRPEELRATYLGEGLYRYTLRQVVEPWIINVLTEPSDAPNSALEITTVGPRVWTYARTLYIESAEPVRVNLYTLSGTLYRRIDAPAGQTRLQSERGLYIVEINNKYYKVLVK